MPTFDESEYEGWDAIPAAVQEKIKEDRGGSQAAEAKFLLPQEKQRRDELGRGAQERTETLAPEAPNEAKIEHAPQQVPNTRKVRPRHFSMRTQARD